MGWNSYYKTNYFVFNNSVYQLISGSEMDTKAAPTLAYLVMNQHAGKTCEETTRTWKYTLEIFKKTTGKDM